MGRLRFVGLLGQFRICTQSKQIYEIEECKGPTLYLAKFTLPGLLASAHSYFDMKRHLAGYVGGCWRIPVVACQCWHMLLIYCVCLELP